MISCGVQCLNCDYPIHMDTYSGCTHACKYCFVKHQHNIGEIKVLNSERGLKDFIAGKRNNETRWCDWDIPLHWGANSDPFQTCEEKYKASLACLRIFAKTGYPFIVSTKNPVLLCKDEYLKLIKQCNCVIQISMACSRYDKLEPGAPSFEERLKAAEKLSGIVVRVVGRIQPYFPDAHKDILSSLEKMKEAGIQGILIEGYRSAKGQKGMIKVGGKLHKFPTDLLYRRFSEIKEKCHELGLEFTCVEEGLDWMSDNLTCCGTSDLTSEGFLPTTYNISRIAFGEQRGQPAHATDAMKKHGTTRPFKCIKQTQEWALFVKNKTYAEMIDYYAEQQVDQLRATEMRYNNGNM